MHTPALAEHEHGRRRRCRRRPAACAAARWMAGSTAGSQPPVQSPPFFCSRLCVQQASSQTAVHQVGEEGGFRVFVFQAVHGSKKSLKKRPCAVLLRLFPDECPRTVENFTTHARNGYYDGVLFHRVIKGFMLQTGDPLGGCVPPGRVLGCMCRRAGGLRACGWWCCTSARVLYCKLQAGDPLNGCVAGWSRGCVACCWWWSLGRVGAVLYRTASCRRAACWVGGWVSRGWGHGRVPACASVQLLLLVSCMSRVELRHHGVPTTCIVMATLTSPGRTWCAAPCPTHTCHPQPATPATPAPPSQPGQPLFVGPRRRRHRRRVHLGRRV